jgi:hypothetical protein
VFKNRVLRKIIGPTCELVTVIWRKLHRVELNNLYSLPNVFWIFKRRRMRWVGYVAQMRQKRNPQRAL